MNWELKRRFNIGANDDSLRLNDDSLRANNDSPVRQLKTSNLKE